MFRAARELVERHPSTRVDSSRIGECLPMTGNGKVGVDEYGEASLGSCYSATEYGRTSRHGQPWDFTKISQRSACLQRLTSTNVVLQCVCGRKSRKIGFRHAVWSTLRGTYANYERLLPCLHPVALGRYRPQCRTQDAKPNR